MTAPHDHIDTVSEFDWELVTFVVQWARYGGPDPGEVFSRFGMTCSRMRERLDEIIAYVRRRPHRANAEQRELIALAERWLSVLPGDSPYSAPVAPSPEDALGVEGEPILSRGVWRWRKETFTARPQDDPAGVAAG
ncbi:hypothetical protein [Mycobacterium sp. ACS4331]|uniref:hypothetical protein n=1 Tax=Mycobacterium sp. ACS4331 TaxID=1834121 RepID=UPI0007FFEE9F|nr:hypothetical protein [Mycobacterium sp. ACS4331]OBF26401.1 hypothetical protein A5727_03085 [Mycobacterium sp. ACS4331]